MSRQRPYGTFEDGFTTFLIKHCPEEFDEFILELIKFTKLSEKRPDFMAMRLPYIFFDTPELCLYWMAFCQMYGDMTFNVIDSEIPSKNLSMALDHVLFEVRKVILLPYSMSDLTILNIENLIVG